MFLAHRGSQIKSGGGDGHDEPAAANDPCECAGHDDCAGDHVNGHEKGVQHHVSAPGLAH